MAPSSEIDISNIGFTYLFEVGFFFCCLSSWTLTLLASLEIIILILVRIKLDLLVAYSIHAIQVIIFQDHCETSLYYIIYL